MDDVALANPRVAPGGGLALPRPLSPSEAARIRRIFTLQSSGDIPAAIRATADMDAETPLGHAMLGHVLADRYLGRYTRPDADTLRTWLAEWGGLPDAAAIHALLLVRLPRNAARPAAPVGGMPMPANDDGLAPVPEESEPAGLAIDRNGALDRAVHEAARSGRPFAAHRLIAGSTIAAPGYAALLRGEAAQILFTLNRDEEAFATAAAGVSACRARPVTCREAALAGYMAGLAAWRLGRFEQARPMFEAAWRAELTTPSLKSAAAFWSARSQLRTGEASGYVPWMLRAGEPANTFYGLLARRALGLARERGGAVQETLAEADLEAVAATPEGLRAFALLQLGQTARAEAELRALWPAVKTAPSLGRAVMLVAARAGFIDLAARLADLVQAADGRPRDRTRFAVPRLHPDGGFTVDPAMVYALARTESNFDAGMVSPAGARGLLQIMPDTARFIVQTVAGAATGSEGASVGALHDPAVNLNLGQRYVSYLAGHDAVAGDLIRLLASYNSGPGSFGRWGPTVHGGGDPLLFIEAIPIDETRAFVPRVLAYTWIYAARLHLPTPSLDELAAGEWPRYHALDAQQKVAARLH